MKLTGVFNVISTPMKSDDSIDFEILEKELEWLIKCGSDGIVLAMVSEVLRFSAEERRDQWKSVIKSLNGRIPLITSVGAESTAIAKKLAQWAQEDGAAAIMATPPSALPATDVEILKYYTDLIDCVSIPVIIQDASNYIGKPLDISMYVQLIDKYGNERVQFKPEAKPVVERLELLNKASGNRAKVFEGQGGADLLGTFPLGVIGTMPGAEIPWALVALWNALTKGDQGLAQDIHKPLLALISYQISLDAYVAIEKYLLVKQGIFTSAHQRGPLSYHLSDEVRRSVDIAYEELISVVKPVTL